jgi:hypothetical protein
MYVHIFLVFLHLTTIFLFFSFSQITMASRFLLMLGVLQASNAFVLPQSSIQAPTALSGWFDKPVGGGGGSGAGRLDEEVGLLKMEMNDIFLLERLL